MAKIRLGFVSNSSSSSFLLFVPKSNKTINSREEYREYLLNCGFYDEEDAELALDSEKDKMQALFDKGLGFLDLDVEHWCEEVIREIADALGGEYIEGGY
jgi:hypothetical protein